MCNFFKSFFSADKLVHVIFIIGLIVHNRFMNGIASKWVFVVLCFSLKIVEGVGTAILNTFISPKLLWRQKLAISKPQGPFELGYAMGWSHVSATINNDRAIAERILLMISDR